MTILRARFVMGMVVYIEMSVCGLSRLLRLVSLKRSLNTLRLILLALSMQLGACSDAHDGQVSHALSTDSVKLLAQHESAATEDYAEFRILTPSSSVQKSAELISLGERLFHDARLSGSMDVSCASCHQLTTGGDDQLAISIGTQGRLGTVNAPTVMNAGLNFVQFWDGRAASLADQIDGPIHDTNEMDSSWPQIVERLKADKHYQERFLSLFEEGISPSNIKAAIVAFENSLLTPSRFDAFLAGDVSLLNEQERKGLNLFLSLGCAGCHQGVNLGGNMYQYLGLMGNYFADRGDVKESDLGLFNVTKRDQDRYKFRVPSLRNVAQTAPYFHDGSVDTLEDAVIKMAYYQLGFSLEEEQALDIVAFLKTLDGSPVPNRLNAAAISGVK